MSTMEDRVQKLEIWKAETGVFLGTVKDDLYGKDSKDKGIVKDYTEKKAEIAGAVKVIVGINVFIAFLISLDKLPSIIQKFIEFVR